ncbi:MAG: sulfhydrogenase subunit delta [Gammaproteobacteria bacterium]
MVTQTPAKPRVAVHKFSSCDGCQLAFLNAGEALLQLAERVEIVHFAEAGPFDPETPVDIAFVEGSISTGDEVERIRAVRANSRLLVTLGACATAGGIQALRNIADHEAWKGAVYASPEHIETLAQSRAVAELVPVDFEIQGCPVNGAQVMAIVSQLLVSATPRLPGANVCMECKRAGNACVMVTGDEPCMGPITRGGCGALCPGVGRACYGCFGPVADAGGNETVRNWMDRLHRMGEPDEAVAQRLLFINAHAPRWRKAAPAVISSPAPKGGQTS